MKFIRNRNYTLSDLKCQEAKLEKEKGYFGKDLCTVEINSLEDLLKFKDKYGEIIITDMDINKDIPFKYEIEIYDTCRE